MIFERQVHELYQYNINPYTAMDDYSSPKINQAQSGVGDYSPQENSLKKKFFYFFIHFCFVVYFYLRFEES